MTREEIQTRVLGQLHRIAPEAEPAGIRPDASLREELELDSFDFLQFVIGLHKEFGVEIPEADYGRISTLAGCLDYLAGRAAGA